jgi:hypothetical protein
MTEAACTPTAAEPMHVWSEVIWTRTRCAQCGVTRTVRAERRALRGADWTGKVMTRLEETPMCAPKWRAVAACPCGSTMTASMREIKVTVDPSKRCTRACEQARSASCHCSCGGRNHGVHAS